MDYKLVRSFDSTMWMLIHFKMKVGRALNSPALLADAACTRICIYLSIVLFFASVGYGLTDIGGFDAAGAVLIAGISLFFIDTWLKMGNKAL